MNYFIYIGMFLASLTGCSAASQSFQEQIPNNLTPLKSVCFDSPSQTSYFFPDSFNATCFLPSQEELGACYGSNHEFEAVITKLKQQFTTEFIDELKLESKSARVGPYTICAREKICKERLWNSCSLIEYYSSKFGSNYMFLKDSTGLEPVMSILLREAFTEKEIQDLLEFLVNNEK